LKETIARGYSVVEFMLYGVHMSIVLYAYKAFTGFILG
jgi:hypothetical protein